MSKDKVVEKEARSLRAQNAALKKQVSRLRKKLGRFAPVEESPESVEVTTPGPEVVDEDRCPQCGGGIYTLTTPGNSQVLFCKAKCGYRKKQ